MPLAACPPVQPKHTGSKLPVAHQNLDQDAEDWHATVVTLSEAKGLSVRCFAPLLRNKMLVP